MSGTKTKMSKEQQAKCHGVIHSASALAGTAGAIPIPIADAVPITAAQITMIISLGKIFDMTIEKGVAKSIIAVGLAVGAGRHVATSVLKVFPGIGSVAGAATAVAITEALGWSVADDFYRISIGEKPRNITGAVNDLIKSGSFEGLANIAETINETHNMNKSNSEENTNIYEEENIPGATDDFGKSTMDRTFADFFK